VSPTQAVELTITDREFAEMRDLIHETSGISLKDCKRVLVVSRLARRLRELRLSSFSEYLVHLRRADPSGDEMRRMINCITTNKTSFFREESHFPCLAAHLRTVFAGGRRAFRLWSAACSTGEEPYSIAMTALDAVPGAEIHVLGSDVDTEVLARAGQGVYPAAALDDLDSGIKRRWFLRGRAESEGLVQVKPEVRRAVEFRRINLVEEHWPVYGKLDAIFCRNVIIYFNRETQRRLFDRLIPRLAPDGLLFVGHSESLFWLSDLVEPVQHAVYRPRSL
jgi:chemotaxis protein methyltransferase CheR